MLAPGSDFAKIAGLTAQHIRTNNALIKGNFMHRTGFVRTTMFSGFTLLELLTALTITAILLGVAVPSLQSLRLRDALQTQAKMVFRFAQASRASSLDSALSITLCGTHDFQHCTDKEFYTLMAFADTNDSKEREESEPLLHQYSIPKNLVMHLKASSNARLLKFRAEGNANPNGSFYVCAANKSVSAMGLRVITSFVGRNQLERHSPTELDECR
jgi:type IV fimbrial biogenesis protein FimT